MNNPTARVMELVDEQRKNLHTAPDGTALADDVLPRSDEFTLACAILDEIDRPANPTVHSDGRFWSYEDSGAWRRREPREVARAAAALNGRRIYAGKDPSGAVVTKRLALKMAGVTAIERYCETLLDRPAFFEHSESGLVFRNGTVTVTRDGAQVKAHHPSNRARDSFDFAFREHGVPRWSGFLRDVWRDDDDQQEKIDFLQEFIGACLIGKATVYEKAVVLLGVGGNGKSVLLSVLRRCFPRTALTSIAPQQWEEEYYRALLVGSRLNVVSELPQRDVVDAPSINAILSGEQVTARRPREEPFDFMPRAGHVFAANPPLPQISDTSRGFWRRLVVVSFNRRFENDPAAKDKDALTAELCSEIPGIVWWAITGAVRLLRNGRYTQIPSSVEQAAEWRISSDQVAQFLREKCEGVTDPYDATGDMVAYQQFRKWAMATGHQRLVHFSNFLARLSALGYTAVEHRGEKVRMLRVRDADADPTRAP